MLEAVDTAVVHAPPMDATPDEGGVSARVRPAPVGLRARLLPTYKVLLLGDASVGKTNLLTRFASGQFDPTSRATVGVEFVAREVDLRCGDEGFDPHRSPTAPDGPPAGTASSDNMERSFDGEERPPTAHAPSTTGDHVVLQLWDTAGQETSFALSSVYYRHAHGVVLVYDVTRRESLHNVAGWLSRARLCVDPDCIFVVVGNKSDLRRQIEVPVAEAEEFCHRLGCRHFLASALTGGGVPNAFLQLLLSVHTTMQLRECANEPAFATVASSPLPAPGTPVLGAPKPKARRRFRC